MEIINLHNVRTIGKFILKYPSLPSTQLMAHELLTKTSPASGTTILTYNQTSGIGQLGKKWHSGSGCNIALSVILEPNTILPSQVFLLNLAVTLGLYDFTTRYINNQVSIKWPNDIYVVDRKIAGILIQNQFSGTKIQSCIAGIGININQFNFPPDLENPTSLLLETGQEFDLDTASAQLCEALDKRFDQVINQQDPTLLWESYNERLYRRGIESSFELNDKQVITAVITGVDNWGRLVVQTNKGEKYFQNGEIKYLI